MTKKATVLSKDRTVKVRTKTGGEYSYKFTTLGAIHEHLEATNRRYYAFIRKADGDDYLWIQKLELKDGKWVPDGEALQETKIPAVQGVQDYGGVLTTCRRYSLLMAYGLACEDDDNEKEQNRGWVTESDAKKAQDEWKFMHTPSPNKPATEKQLGAIRTWSARAGLTLQQMNSLIENVKSSAEASKLIDDLVAKAARKAEE